jgi:hypothetical protein
MHALLALSRFFGYLALRLYTHGPLPESAFHTSLSGERTAASAEYRRIYLIGQVVGWTLVALGLLLLGLLLRWLVTLF